MILTSTPDLAAFLRAIIMDSSGARYGVVMYSLRFALTIMDRYCICTGLLGMVSGPPDTSCILS